MEPLEVHTSELTDSCLRHAQLRIEGKEHRTAETALFRGLLAGVVMEHLHAGEDATAADCLDEVIAKLDMEGRQVSAAVAANYDGICGEIDAITEPYVRRIMPLFDEVIGTELPVSMMVDVDGEDVRFASHIDLLAIGADPYTGERSVMVVDWKWRQEAPTMAYLVRNLQFGMYQMAVKADAVEAAWWWTGEPVRAYWCHLPNLKPYGRKTVVRDNGEDVEYAKGDERPLTKIMYEATCNDDDAVYAAFAERVRMMRAGFWPANPDPVGCFLCQTAHACDAWGNHGN